MTSNILIYTCLLTFLCCSSTLDVDKIPTMALTNMSNNKNMLSRWYKYYQTLNNLYSDSIINSPLISSTNIQRRNVIMPRICYFARVTKSGIHQKVCLPYNNNNQP